ncbi:MAG TPA: polyprenyl synthetase family protein, partial [Thermoanaerobaculia bacterium]|nr:polyprenyl synthetase family protein [Thermoanaerobaculia bacterium]
MVSERTTVTFEAIKQRVRSVAEVAAWPQMLQLMERAMHRDLISVWDHPSAACRAVGGDAEAALPGAAAIFCSLIGIHLVDDMLDNDPKGDYHLMGTGKVANLALAFQAAGHLLLHGADASPRVRAELQASFARMSIGTSYGQDLDTRDLRTEDEYWQTVKAKTPPLFGAAFRIGALLGGATEPVADGLEVVGGLLGCFTQVSDDLSDSLHSPASADWLRRGNNLPILYAMTAEHPARETFLELSARADNPEALAEAQKILLKSGAVSYCTFKMMEIAQEARTVLSRLPLRDP